VAFGSGPFGAMAFGSGGGVAIASAEQVTLNTVRVRLLGTPSVQNRGAVFDALYDRGWSIERYNDPHVHVPIVYWVEREDPNTVVLQLDAPLDGPDKLYRVVMSEAIAQGSTLDERLFIFPTFGAPRALVNAETRRSFDVANLPAGDSGPGIEPALGTFQYAADGDYQNDAGLANLKKRVIRRLTTKRGSFAHMPNYGLDLPEKGPMRPGVMRQLQSQAIAQVQAEEGVVSASVSVSVPAPGVFLLGVRVQASSGAFGVDVTIGGSSV
jgi:hypothetical protein